MQQIPYLRVFLSSPGDVTQERKLALDVIENLPNRPVFREKVQFRVIAWDKPGASTAMRGSLTPQEAINKGLPRPSECDIVIVLFWGRMGTPFTMDGQEFLSGTHWELLDGLNSVKSEVIIYRRQEAPDIRLDDPKRDEKSAQYDKVKSFFESDLFYDPNTGGILRGVNKYDDPDAFHREFETHFEELVLEILEKIEQKLPVVDVDIDTSEEPESENIKVIKSTTWEKSPFPGLRAFTEDDAPIFFGRVQETDAVLRRIASSRFVAVVGASGSGKSSLVRAGVIPQLAAGAIAGEQVGSQDWKVVSLVPGRGRQPFEALYDAMLETFPKTRPNAMEAPRVRRSFLEEVYEHPASFLEVCRNALLDYPQWAEILLVIDQFEELFTLVDEKYRSSFIKLVTNPSNQIRTIVTLRADFYNRCLEYPDLAKQLENSTYPLVAPTGSALRAMISRPAEVANLEFEEGLVDHILDDTGDEPGSLALMAYLLDLLYEKRDNGQLTQKAYEDLGRVQGAIGKRAENIYQYCPPKSQEQLTVVFQELLNVNDQGIAVRERAYRSQFEENPHALLLINKLTEGRLLVQSTEQYNGRHEIIEVAHEELLRSWDRLTAWLHEAHEDILLQQKVSADAEDWDSNDRQGAWLYRDTQLAQARAWLDRNVPKELDKAFLDASLDAERERLARESEADQRTRRLQKRLRNILGVLVLVLGIATVVFVYLRLDAVDQRDNARAAKALAENEVRVRSTAQAEAYTLALVANAQLARANGDMDLALALALEAGRAENPPAQVLQLLRELADSPGLKRVMTGQQTGIWGLALSADNRFVLSGGGRTSPFERPVDNNTVLLWDLETGQIVQELIGHEDAVTHLTFVPGKMQALSAGLDSNIILWDLQTGDEIRRFHDHEDAVLSLAVTSDGNSFLSAGGKLLGASGDTVIRLWDIETGEVVRRFDDDQQVVASIAMSPDGKVFAAGGGNFLNNQDTIVRLWDIETGEILDRLDQQRGFVFGVAFDPDGERLLSSTANPVETGDALLHIWDIGTGEELRTIDPGVAAFAIAYSPSGRTVASGSLDGSVQVWDTLTGNRVEQFLGHKSHVYGLIYFDDGLNLLSSSDDRTLHFWNLGGVAEVSRYEVHQSAVYDAYQIPGLPSMADKDVIVSADFAGNIVLLNADTHEILDEVQLDQNVQTLAVSPDGSLLLSGGGDVGGEGDYSIVLWDLGEGRLKRVRQFDDGSIHHTDTIQRVAFSPKGQTFISVSLDGSAILWDLKEGRPLLQVVSDDEGHTDAIADVAFMPDGEAFVTASWDGTLILWDTQTGEMIRDYRGHQGQVWSVAISPNGQSMISVGEAGEAIVWDIESGEIQERLVGHTNTVSSVDYSHDGQMAVSSGWDNMIILWDLATGRPLRRYVGHSDRVQTVRFNPDGETILSASFDHTVREWVIQDTDDLIEAICTNRVVHSLTEEERATYQITEEDSVCTTYGLLPTD